MEAVVTAVQRSSIDVHYVGWSDKYDTRVESGEYKQRIAPQGKYSEEVVHYSCCDVCDDGGDNRPLVCCDGCPRVIHQQCARLRSLPKGDYFCPDCVKHKRGKRVIKDKRDLTQYEEEDDDEEEDGEEKEEEEEEREKENHRAGRRAAPASRRGATASKPVRSASPTQSAPSVSSAADERLSGARPSDRRALATKAGKSRLGPNAGLQPAVQRGAQKEVQSIIDDDDDDDEVTEDTERKEQPPRDRKRPRNDSNSAEQPVRTSSRTAAVSSSTINLFQRRAAVPPEPEPAPLPPIHLAAGVSSAANQSSRKRIRANSATQQQLQQPQQSQQQQADGSAVSSKSVSEEEKKEAVVENDNKKPTAPLTSFVDCLHHQAARHGRTTTAASPASSSALTTSFTADSLPAVGIPPFSFPSSNFEGSSADAYIAHFCSLLDTAADKVRLSVPSELPGVERWERIRERMEEVGQWVRMKCNQQINGEQNVVKDKRQLIERQTAHHTEQLERFEQQSNQTTKQREAVVADIAAIDQQIEQLRQRREQKAQELAQREADISQVDASREESKREHDRKVATLEADARKATHRVHMLRDLSEHVAARREEGDEKEQTGQYWEPLDTIRRRCASMTSGMRLREADRTNSNGSVRREEVKEVEEPHPAAEEREESKTAPLSVAAAVANCVNTANAFVSQTLRNTLLPRRDEYQQASFVDEFDEEAEAEIQSADVATPLDVHSSFPLSHVRLSSASFASLSSLSSASTISEVPHVLPSSSDDSVSSTQTTLPVSPAHGDGAVEGWGVQRMDGVAEEVKEAGGVVGMVDTDEAPSDVSSVRRLSVEHMEELTAVAEEQLTPEKRVAVTEASGSDQQEGSGDAAAASVDADGSSG